MLKNTAEKAKEKTLERALTNFVKQKNGWAIKLLSTHITGLPDRLVLMPGGVIFFVEVKSTGKTPTPIQIIIHGKLRKIGFDVWVLDSTEVLEQIKAWYGNRNIS